ncbi:MAG: carboxypeptidase-like regulatory domain-containing protein [Pyrinomonadaceae bacterium]|nr:carboxypeptidase-like regulatory domain-containing protein [Pyrinomonadaceae bacterium]
MNIKLATCVFLVGLAAFSVLAQEGELASVRGRVTTLWGQPIEEAQVSFFQLEGIRGNSATEKLIHQTLTSRNGEYKVNALPWGQYRVDVALKGYGHTEVWRFYLWRSARRVLDVGVPMGMLHHISQMEIRGTVRKSKREAVEDATVTLTSVFDQSESQQVRTDADGKYSFLLMQEGDYLLHSSKPGYKASVTTISISTGEHTTADLVLTPTQPNQRSRQTH